jgi:translation initiation factor 2 alpha subunit (eIF-2alpha)
MIGGSDPHGGKKVNQNHAVKSNQTTKIQAQRKKPSKTTVKVGIAKVSSQDKTSKSKQRKRYKSFDKALDIQTADHDAADKKAGEWDDAIHKKYKDHDIMTIKGMHAYYENIHNGFKCTAEDEEWFQDAKASDKSGVLLEEAKRGFELSKVCIHYLNEHLDKLYGSK